MSTLELPERLLIAECAALREELLAALECAEAPFVIDAKAVRDVDGAGLQLLLSTALEARKRGVRLELDASQGLSELLQVLRLEHRFQRISETSA